MKRVISITIVILLTCILVAGCAQNAGPEKPSTTIPQQPLNQTASGSASSSATANPAVISPSASSVAPFNGHYIDVHGHIRPGSMTYPDLLSSMDAGGIDTLIIMEPPGSVWLHKISPSEYGIPDAAATYPKRFIVLYSGDAGVMLYNAARTGTYTQEDTTRFTALLEEAMKSGSYRGFGEIGVRHFPPKGMPQTFDITVPADHPWMFIMSDIAAKYGVPIDIHMEATTETVQGLERLLAHNRNTAIIWDHAGWGNTPDNTPELMRKLLTENPNLSTSIKFRKDMSDSGFLNSDGTINAAWLAVVKDFPDRFMMGSDIKPGIYDNEFRQVKDHISILSQLPPAIQGKVARENAQRIFT